MDEKTKDLLCRILDMSETEMRAALLEIADGVTLQDAVDAAYNSTKRQIIKATQGFRDKP